MDKIKEYFNTKALSNSGLGLMNNPRWVKLRMDNPDMEDDDKVYFRIGSALDCLLTSPERWETDFMVVDVNRPYGLLAKFVDNMPAGLDKDSSYFMYQEAYDKSGYKMNIEKVIANFWDKPEAVDYYMMTRNIAENVTILSKDEYESVLKAQELILANEFLYKYFKKTSIELEIMQQIPVYFNYRGEKCKALLDGLLIDHKNKTIEPYDLKTTGKSVYDFPQSYLMYGYYRQCAMYELALYSDNSPVKEYLDAGYKMLDYLFIVVESKKSSSHPAIIYVTNERDREVGLNGGHIGTKKYKGINQLIAEYKFHRDNNYWDLPMDLLQNQGRIQLNIFDELIESVPDSDVGDIN